MICKVGFLSFSIVTTFTYYVRQLISFSKWVLDSLRVSVSRCDLPCDCLWPLHKLHCESHSKTPSHQQHTWWVIYRPIKTGVCIALIQSRIVWRQVFAANLGQKQEPGSVVSRPFWSHHKLPLHVGEREQQGCCFTSSHPPVFLCVCVCTSWSVSFCVQCPVPVSSQPPWESGVQTGVAGVSLASGECGSGGLSCSLRLLTGPARVWTPSLYLSFLSGVFVLVLCCVRDQHRAGLSRRRHGGYQV